MRRTLCYILIGLGVLAATPACHQMSTSDLETLERKNPDAKPGDKQETAPEVEKRVRAEH